jgi:hypothetical protein
MSFEDMMINDLMENELYKEKDVYLSGFAVESRPHIEHEVIQAYKLGYLMAMKILSEKVEE